MLKIDSFTSCRSTYHHLRTTSLLKFFLGGDFAAVVAPLEHNDPLARIGPTDLVTKHFDAAKVGGEDDDLFVRILSPEHPKGGNQLYDFRLGLLGEFFEQRTNPLTFFWECQFDGCDRRILGAGRHCLR